MHLLLQQEDVLQLVAKALMLISEPDINSHLKSEQ